MAGIEKEERGRDEMGIALGLGTWVLGYASARGCSLQKFKGMSENVPYIETGWMAG